MMNVDTPLGYVVVQVILNDNQFVEVTDTSTNLPNGLLKLGPDGLVPPALLGPVSTGVASVNTRTGAVVITAADITTGTLNNSTIPVTIVGHTYDGLTNTSLSTGFTITGGTTPKTLTVNNTLTLAGQDGSVLNIGTGGTLATSAFINTTDADNISSGSLNTARLPPVISGITTYDNLTLTALSTGFTIAGGTTSKTLTVSNNIAVAGIDGATVATLDMSTNKLLLSQMPDINVLSFLGTVNSQTSMTTIGVPPNGLPLGTIGDLTYRSDTGTAWILINADQTQFANWVQLLYPPVYVTSVAGRTGAITLTASDIYGLVSSATTDTTNASNITSGTFNNSLLPANIAVTTYDGLTLTALSTGFTIAGGTTSKTVTVDNTIAFAGIDASTLNIGLGGTLAASAYSDTTDATNITSGTLANAELPSIISGITTYNGLTLTPDAVGYTITGGTTSKVLTVDNTIELSGTDATTYNLDAIASATNASNITSGTINNAYLPVVLTGHTYDGLTNTSLSTGFTIASTTKTLTVDNTMVLVGNSDGITLNIGSGGTLVNSAYTDTTNASNITTGTINNARLPYAFTGHTYDGLTNTVLSTGYMIAGGMNPKTLTVDNTIGLSGTDGTTYDLDNMFNTTDASNITSGTLNNARLPVALINHSYDGLTNMALSTGFNITGGTTSKTLTVNNTLKLAGIDTSTLNISGSGTLVTSAFTDTTNASHITTGTINNAYLPIALTGHTYDGLTDTALNTGFMIAGGVTSKTLTVNNTVTLAGVDSSTLNIGTGGTLVASAYTDTTNASNISSGTLINSLLPIALTGHTYDGLTNTALSTGFMIAGGTNSKVLTVDNTLTLVGVDTSTLNIDGGGTLTTSAFTDTTDATNITSGTLNTVRLPANISGITTYNDLTLTSDAVGFMIAGGTISKTMTVSNNIIVAGIDGSTVATLDNSTGKLALTQLPEIAIVSFLGTVESQSAMTTIGTPPTGLPTAVMGDWTIRSDTGMTWILTGSDQTIFANWLELSYPPVSVTSVAGRTGAVVLSSTDVSGLATSATTDTTNASNISSGTMSNSRLAANISGSMTFDGLTNTALSTGFSIAGGTNPKTLTVTNTISLAGTDSSTLNISTGGTLHASAFTDTTNASHITSGTLNNSLLPVALTGHTYNGLTNTALSTGFTIAGGTTSKVLTVDNTLTLAGTDSSTLNIGSGGTLVASAFTNTTNASTISSGTISLSQLPTVLTGHTYNGLTLTSASTGFTIAGGTTSKTLTVNNTVNLAGVDSSTLNISTGGTLAASAFTDTTNASNISTGTLNNARLPTTLTGHTYNGLTNTALSTGFSIAGGTNSKTLTVNNTIGLSGTNGTTYNLDTLATTAGNASNISAGLLGVAYGGTDISTVPVNGALLIGNGTNYTSAKITQGSANRVIVTNGTGSITLSTPQDINTFSNVNFGTVTATATNGNFIMSGSGSALVNTNKFGNLSRVDISTTIPWSWSNTSNINVNFALQSGVRINCSAVGTLSNAIVCAIPPIRQGMRLAYQQVRTDLSSSYNSVYCAFSANNAQSITVMYFGLGSVDYIMTSYPSYTSSTFKS